MGLGEQDATQRVEPRSRIVEHLENMSRLAGIEQDVLLFPVRPEDSMGEIERPSMREALGQLFGITRAHAHTGDLHPLDFRQVGRGKFGEPSDTPSATDRDESRHATPRSGRSVAINTV